MTALADTDVPDAGASQATAISAAQSEVGPGLKEVGVLRAMASQFVDEPERAVWVVLISGAMSAFTADFVR